MRAIVAVLLATVAVGATAGTARAHGDPASEYLAGHDVFFPISRPLADADRARIAALVAEARRKGYPIRVALIGSRSDLGTEADAWLRPAVYARAVGADIAYDFSGTLLVVMPNGFGLAHPRHATAADRSLLAAIRVGAGSAGLAAAAERAVERLAAAHGVALSAPQNVATSAERNRHDRIVIVAATAAVLLVWLLARRLVRRRPPRPSSAA